MELGTTAEFNVQLCRAILIRFGRFEPDQLIVRLDEAIAADYEVWRKNAHDLDSASGEVADQIAPPRDVTSYIIDVALPYSVRRHKDYKISESNKMLRQLIRELDERYFFCLLVLYAVQKADLEALWARLISKKLGISERQIRHHLEDFPDMQ